MWTVMNEYLANISNDHLLKAFENSFFVIFKSSKKVTLIVCEAVWMNFTSATDSKLSLIFLNKYNI